MGCHEEGKVGSAVANQTGAQCRLRCTDHPDCKFAFRNTNQQCLIYSKCTASKLVNSNNKGRIHGLTCDYHKGGCHANADCSDDLGYIVCTCKEGFLGDGFDCITSTTWCEEALFPPRDITC